MYHDKKDYSGTYQSAGQQSGAGSPQFQTGQQMGNYVNPVYGSREENMVSKIADDFSYTGTQTTGFNTGQSSPFGTGQSSAFTSGQASGSTSGQSWVGGFQSGQQAANFGAHEIMVAHEILTDKIDGINKLELYRPHIKDQQLMQIVDNQLSHMFHGYQNMVNYLHNQGGGTAVPYRAPKTSSVKYGLRQPSPIEPNLNANQIDDRDIASGILGCQKASAILATTAALECADPELRSRITNCSVSAINMAYEVFIFMNQKGMYQVPTLASQTTQTMMNTYQAGSMPQFQTTQFQATQF